MLNRTLKQNLMSENDHQHSQELASRILSQSVIIAVNNAMSRLFYFHSKDQKHLRFHRGEFHVDLLTNGLSGLELKITSTTNDINRESLKRCDDLMVFNNRHFSITSEMWFQLLFGLNKISFEMISKIQVFNLCHPVSDSLSHATSPIELETLQKVESLLHVVFAGISKNSPNNIK